MNEFLNPKSMLTPGAAGSMVMLITNALCLSFAIGKPQWLALLLSFLFGAFVLSSSGLKKTLKLGFWFVNSLIIFSVSVGTAKFAAERAENAAASTTVPAAPDTSAAVPAVGGPDLLGLLIPSAVAQQVSTPRADHTAEQQRQLVDRLLRENQTLKQELRSTQAADPPATAPPATEAVRLEAARQALAAERLRAALEAARLREERAALENAQKAEASAKQNGMPNRFFRKW